MRRARASLARRAQGALAAGVALALGLLAGCSSGVGPVSVADSAAAAPALLNDRLSERGLVAQGTGGEERSYGDYRVGPDDVLELSVFQAEEFDRTLRVRPDGSIALPLIGRLEVAGLTTGELERALADRLGERYLRDPQVSVFVAEYRAHPVSIFGEVNHPGVYYLRGPRTLVEMLTEAGGLTEEAGTILHLRRRPSASPASTIDVAAAPNLLTLDLQELLERPDSGFGPMLRDHDSIYVPKAGTVFVEGAVEKPGAYPLHGAATVLRAVALAGGLKMTALRSRLKVIRADDPLQTVHVDYDEIREDVARDVPIHDGDVVVVESSIVKTTLLGLYRGVAGLVNVTTGF